MIKHKLLLPTGFRKYDGWNWTLCRMLEKSKLFVVDEFTFPYQAVRGARNGNWCTIQVDDIRIGLDTWDTYSPLCNYFDNGFFDNIFKDIKLIIKIQYYDCTFYKGFTEKTGIKVSPWTVMPTKNFPLECFQWENKSHKWITTVTGKNNRFKRQPWTKFCEDHKDLFYSSGAYTVNDNTDSYIDRLKECKWGMILKGKTRNHDGKNRRECEFTSCGMPLALNYVPTYPFSFKPKDNFVLLEKPEDLLLLKDINPEPYSRASRDLYYSHFSTFGIAKTLLNILSL